MNVYHLPDLDGLTEALVAALRLDEAAASLGMTVRTVRERGWLKVKGAKAAPALKQPGQALYRPILGARGAWQASLERARASAARAALRGASRSP